MATEVLSIRCSVSVSEIRRLLRTSPVGDGDPFEDSLHRYLKPDISSSMCVVLTQAHTGCNIKQKTGQWPVRLRPGLYFPR